jgi:Coenzyme PQQ synthesis protein D (PqqD)
MDGEGPGWAELRLRRVRVPAHVATRAFPRETVLLNVRTGQYHSVDEVGTRFLEVLRDAPDVQTACLDLAKEYGQPFDRIQTDLSAFALAMQQHGLIELVG